MLFALEWRCVEENVFDLCVRGVCEGGHGVPAGGVQHAGALAVQRRQPAQVDQLALHAELKTVLELEHEQKLLGVGHWIKMEYTLQDLFEAYLAKKQLQVQPTELVAEDGHHSRKGRRCLLKTLQHS